MAQPGFRILANTLTTASQQLALVPNVPAVNDSQASLTSLNGIRDDIRGLRGEVRGMPILSSETSAVVRLFNSTIQNP